MVMSTNMSSCVWYVPIDAADDKDNDPADDGVSATDVVVDDDDDDDDNSHQIITCLVANAELSSTRLQRFRIPYDDNNNDAARQDATIWRPTRRLWGVEPRFLPSIQLESVVLLPEQHRWRENSTTSIRQHDYRSQPRKPEQREAILSPQL